MRTFNWKFALNLCYQRWFFCSLRLLFLSLSLSQSKKLWISVWLFTNRLTSPSSSFTFHFFTIGIYFDTFLISCEESTVYWLISSRQTCKKHEWSLKRKVNRIWNIGRLTGEVHFGTVMEIKLCFGKDQTKSCEN